MDLSDAELLERYANCYTTASRAGGHWKAQQNEIQMRRYEDEFFTRGLSVPSKEELKELGKFNGVGSY